MLDSVYGRTTGPPKRPPRRRGGWPTEILVHWLAWVIPLIAFSGWPDYLASRAPQTTAPTATTTAQPATRAAANLTVDGVDLGASVTCAIDGLKASSKGITDAATAKAALPKLQDATSALEKVNGMTGKLQAEQKSALAALIAAALPVINPLIDKVLAIWSIRRCQASDRQSSGAARCAGKGMTVDSAIDIGPC